MMLIALMLAGVADGVGVSALLPLLSVAMQGDTSIANHLSLPRTHDGGNFTDTVTAALYAVGITPTIGMLLVVIVVAMTLKSVLLLVAQKRIGYMVAQVTMDLRLALLRSILAARWTYFIGQPVGRLANAMAIEPLHSAEAYVQGMTVLTLLMQTGIYTSVALLVSWQATLASLGAGLAILGAGHFLVKIARRAGRRQTALMKSLSARLADTLQSVKPLKAMARENLADTLLAIEAGKLNQALRRAVLSKAALRRCRNRCSPSSLPPAFLPPSYWRAPCHDSGPGSPPHQDPRVPGQSPEGIPKMVINESAFWSLQRTIKGRAGHGALVAWSDDETTCRITLERIRCLPRHTRSPTSLDIPVGTLTALAVPFRAGKTTVVIWLQV
jgi:ATP-binding cassette subfamily C protein